MLNLVHFLVLFLSLFFLLYLLTPYMNLLLYDLDPLYHIYVLPLFFFIYNNNYLLFYHMHIPLILLHNHSLIFLLIDNYLRLNFPYLYCNNFLYLLYYNPSNSSHTISYYFRTIRTIYNFRTTSKVTHNTSCISFCIYKIVDTIKIFNSS